MLVIAQKEIGDVVSEEGKQEEYGYSRIVGTPWYACNDDIRRDFDSTRRNRTIGKKA